MTFKINLLGQFKLQVGDEVIELPSRPAQSLLAYLALHAGIVHRREKLAGLLWPLAAEGSARAYLRQALWRLRKALADAGLNPADYLQISDISITFHEQSDYWLDAELVLGSARDLALVDLAAVTRLYQGELLPGFYDEWLVPERERVQAAYQQRMSALLEGLISAGQWEDALQSAEQWIRFGDAPEPAFRALMRAHAALGDRAMVAATYQRCVESLARELAVEPSAETAALYDQLRRQPAGDRLAPVAARLPAFLDEGQTPPAERPVFVAREAELAELRGHLEEAAAGNGRVIFIVGEAGSGKTALLQAFADRAQEAYPDLVVAGGNCNAHTGMGDPYLPFREILELLTGDVDARWAAGSISPEHAGRLWRAMPLTAQALLDVGPGLVETFVRGRPLIDRLATSAAARPEWLARLERYVEQAGAIPLLALRQQGDLVMPYTRVLQQLGRQVPLLLLIDDLQWADLGSISLLFHLGRQLAGGRILIAGAYRREDVALGRNGGRHPLASVVNELQRAAGNLTIDVDQAAAYRFLAALLDSEPNRLGTPFRQMLYRQTGGHPLFTLEVLRGMQERGDLELDPTGHWVEGAALDWDNLPARVEAVIAERIGRLAEPLQAILRVASVEGEQFSSEVVARVLGLDAAELVQNQCRELDQRHRLIASESVTRLDGQSLSQYRFRHILFQKYLYNTLAEVERAHLHGQVGRAIEDLFGVTDQTAALSPQLARHFREAGVTDKAVRYLQQAGEKAVDMSAHAEGAAHLSEALALLLTLPPTPERTEWEIWLQIGLGKAQSRRILGPKAHEAYSRARELCLKSGQVGPLSHIVGELAIYYYVRSENQRARQMAEEALTLAQATGDPLVEVVGAWYLTFVLFATGDFQAARREMERIVDFYEPEQHHHALVALRGSDIGLAALSYYSCTLWCLGYPEKALRTSRYALEVARQLAHPFSTIEAICYAGCLFNSLRGDVAELKKNADEMLHLATTHGFTGWTAGATQFQGQALAAEGAIHRGIVLMRKGMADNAAMEVRLQYPDTLSSLALAYEAAGDAARGLATIDEAIAFSETTATRYKEAELHRLKAEMLLRSGAAAEAPLLKALEVARQQQARSWELRAATTLARLWREEGREAAARELLGDVYDWFTEGFDTPDLQAAAALLGSLTPGARR